MQLHWFITLLLASSAIAGVVDTFSAPQLAESLGIRDPGRCHPGHADRKDRNLSRLARLVTGLYAGRMDSRELPLLLAQALLDQFWPYLFD
ncbi:hypothetical protein H112_06286 [Trichophyton rubrum D6]|uniref:Uncharacterized protein n=2 Tax=Trichophyton TaxID=5550 RepID=A0A022VVC1_TRIRU|nr:hypothetical protein H100_06300 [Trichophyton rubrum MR850]EZF39663.1 hypothetical protein H102_06267 [Trichophyton rubrum CBS 100081]EZF50187.1 hypothetical protein H103_06292 [Trichophyton rubrum CBS 288.86]EZF60819.1 hypothetical protein H104_06279 [Trichophyton rubrum CBS 289.86]EZF71337.1 hypothetical protein H105_06307 [Trichophyton soudanense CBS 452.61]EZF82146.1 hypothetical protein H110_06289 [Trichophyton rubrum MR1448]EZF92896.1 hypothetical protein H113_06337 [Trichophyton rub